MDDYIEFINEIKKVHEPRVHKITNSYGVYDAFKYYRKIDLHTKNLFYQNHNTLL